MLPEDENGYDTVQ